MLSARILSALVVALLTVAGASCSSEDTTSGDSSTSGSSSSSSSSGGGFDRSCSMSSDCVVVNDCCDGCGAANKTSYTPTPCGASCIIDPCSGEHGTSATFSAVCNAGTCELVVSKGSGGGGGGGNGGGGSGGA